MILKRIGYRIPALLILSVIAYAGTISSQFIADDLQAIQYNIHLGDLRYIVSHYPGMLWALVRHVNYLTGGVEPAHYHITNIFLHCINTLLAYRLVSLVNTKRVGFYAAALFAVHPIATEAVTWISGGSYTLYAAFMLSTLICYASSRERGGMLWMAGAVVFYAAATLTSEKAIVLVPLLLLYSAVRKTLRKDILSLVPFIVVTVVLILIYLPYAAPRVGEYAKHFALSSEVQNPYILVPVSFATYLYLLIWPSGLTLYHVEPVSTLGYVVSFLTVALYGGALVVSYRTDRKLFFWLTFFVISLAPVLTPLRLASFVAERYAYLASIGMFAVAGYAFDAVQKKYVSEKTALLIGGVLVCILLSVTLSRNDEWRDPVSFWTATVRTSPHSYQAHYNLGTLYMADKQVQPAIEEFLTTVQLKSNYDLAYQSLGYAYQVEGVPEEALAAYTMAVKINPSLWPSYKNMGAIYLERKEYDRSLEMSLKAVSIDPSNPDLYTNLGIVYLEKGDKEHARRSFQKALELDPAYEKARYGLGLVK